MTLSLPPVLCGRTDGRRGGGGAGCGPGLNFHAAAWQCQVCGGQGGHRVLGAGAVRRKTAAGAPLPRPAESPRTSRRPGPPGSSPDGQTGSCGGLARPGGAPSVRSVRSPPLLSPGPGGSARCTAPGRPNPSRGAAAHVARAGGAVGCWLRDPRAVGAAMGRGADSCSGGLRFPAGEARPPLGTRHLRGWAGGEQRAAASGLGAGVSVPGRQGGPSLFCAKVRWQP